LGFFLCCLYFVFVLCTEGYFCAFGCGYRAHGYPCCQ
jgi:hypothetical protein